MPRPKKPARLWKRLDDDRWFILDRGKQYATGARGDEGHADAERALSRYLAEKLSLPTTPQPPDAVQVDLVLAYYLENLRPEIAAPETQAYNVLALSPFWSGKSCAEITEKTCQAYAKTRRSPATARRELGTLRAALNAAHRGKLLQAAPAIWLPAKGKPRPTWIDRAEFARVLRQLWRNKRSRHAARLALIQWYTGSRPGTVARTTWRERTDGPWVDLRQRIWHRAGEDEPETVKARRPHRIPRPLLAHLKRWKRVYGGTYVVEHRRWPGRPILDIEKALTTACAKAGVRRITPHSIKHSAITTAIQGGMSLEDAVGYFSTSAETIKGTSWHHSPHHQQAAVSAMSAPGKAAIKRNENATK